MHTDINQLLCHSIKPPALSCRWLFISVLMQTLITSAVITQVQPHVATDLYSLMYTASTAQESDRNFSLQDIRAYKVTRGPLPHFTVRILLFKDLVDSFPNVEAQLLLQTKFTKKYALYIQYMSVQFVPLFMMMYILETKERCESIAANCFR